MEGIDTVAAAEFIARLKALPPEEARSHLERIFAHLEVMEQHADALARCSEADSQEEARAVSEEYWTRWREQTDQAALAQAFVRRKRREHAGAVAHQRVDQARPHDGAATQAPRRGHVEGRSRPGRPRTVTRSSSRGGDSGDSSDEPSPGPGSGRLDSRAAIDRFFAERWRVLQALLAKERET